MMRFAEINVCKGPVVRRLNGYINSRRMPGCFCNKYSKIGQFDASASSTASDAQSGVAQSCIAHMAEHLVRTNTSHQ